MIKAIITDLDGTLLPRGGSISSGTLEAFRLAGNKGCIRIIATGRNLYSALKILPAGFPIDYLVFSSGAGTLRWSDRRLLSAHHLSMSETREIASYLWDTISISPSNGKSRITIIFITQPFTRYIPITKNAWPPTGLSEAR